MKVLITAGASGIGRAMAQGFATSGADVWVTDVDSVALTDVPVDWRRSCVDASDEAGMAALFTELEAEWGVLDVLCANAGIAGPTALIEDVALDDWRRCLQVNLEGAFLASKYAVPLMKRVGSGSVILTSSTAGQYGYPNRAPYAAAKWGIIGLMKTLAMELGPFGIRANAICPGAVAGPRMDGVIAREAEAKGMSVSQVREGYVKGVSMQSFVEASDIADMAVFLASQQARMVSGQVLAVDGHTVNPDPQI